MIYFLQVIPGGPIKIGYSSSADGALRIASLQTSCPWPLRLLGTITGEPEDERRFHKKLNRYRTNGEWFAPESEVLDLVGGLIGKDLASCSSEGVWSHILLDALPAHLYDMVLEISAHANVSIAHVLTEAARSGLKFFRPQWQQGRCPFVRPAAPVKARSFVSEIIDAGKAASKLERTSF